jgi:hypothetical protein
MPTDPGNVVGRRILLYGGEQAQRHGYDGGYQQRQNGQLQRDRKLGGQVLGNGLLKEHGLAEVQPEHAPDPLAVLDVQWFVGSQFGLQIVKLRLCEAGVSRLSCQLHQRWVARDDAQQEKRQQGSHQQGRNEQQAPFRYIRLH